MPQARQTPPKRAGKTYSSETTDKAIALNKAYL